MRPRRRVLWRPSGGLHGTSAKKWRRLDLKLLGSSWPDLVVKGNQPSISAIPSQGTKTKNRLSTFSEAQTKPQQQRSTLNKTQAKPPFTYGKQQKKKTNKRKTKNRWKTNRKGNNRGAAGCSGKSEKKQESSKERKKMCAFPSKI